LYYKGQEQLANRSSFVLQAQRSAEEEGDYLVFEQLVAEAAIKKDKDEDKRKKDKKDKHHRHAEEVVKDAPNVPKA
jgi:hypothetical protein